MNCGLIIPTFNAGNQFEKLLEQISSQSVLTKKLIIDSESTDNTPKLAQKFDLEFLSIPQKKFSHGATRQFAFEYLKEKYLLDIIIFLTQDVLLHDEDSLATLVNIFKTDHTIGVAYGRQLPHKNATVEARFLRTFNYPEKSQIRSFEDRKIFGIKTAFVSNSFAAYRVSALTDVGGFPKNISICEDMYVAAKMLINNLKIAYVADAKVFHSHNYTISQEFNRYFKIGEFHAREKWIRKNFGSAENVGKNFVILKFKKLLKKYPQECLKAIFRDTIKFLGYHLGYIKGELNQGLYQPSFSKL